MKSISVLLSVFGNSPYLPDFLSSLKNQTCGNFQLVYRQDGEGDVDDTLFNFNDSVHLTNSEHFGVVKSYNQLIAKAPDSDYYMFADQDDIWYQDKIEVSRNAIQQAEDIFGANTPILIHSDLRVVDSNLKTISKSFVRYQSLKPCKNDLKDLIIQNNATGCTMIFNRALRNIADIEEGEEVGGLSRCREHGGHTALKCGDLGGNVIVRGVLQSRIEIAACFEVEELAHFHTGVVFIGRALHDGHHARLTVFRRIACLDAKCINCHKNLLTLFMLFWDSCPSDRQCG